MIARKTDMSKIAAAGHEKNFSPSKIVKLSIKPTYEHAPERIHIPINRRDEDGHVII